MYKKKNNLPFSFQLKLQKSDKHQKKHPHSVSLFFLATQQTLLN